MLRQWSIENFKSFRDKTEIRLGDITIISGANSSGKSSIIQSILALKQTLDYAQPNLAIALNGPIVKLGTFDDIRSYNSKSNDFTFSFKLELRSSTYSRSRTHSPIPRLTSRAPRDIEYTMRFGLARTESDSGTAALASLYPILKSCSLSTTVISEERTNPAYLELRHLDNEQPTFFPESSSLLAEYEVVDIDDESTRRLLESKPDGKIVFGTIRHFLPFTIIVQYDRVKQQAALLTEYLTTGLRSYRYLDDRATKAAVPGSLRSLFATAFLNVTDLPEFARDRTIKTITESKDFEELANAIRMASYSDRLKSAVAGLITARPAIERILAGLEPTSDLTIESEYSSRHLDAVEEARAYFQGAIRYLGPLRDEPKPIYPLEALVEPTEVGYHGENTAAVLHLHQSVIIEYIQPPSERSDDQRKRATLHDAVVHWLKYMGVATNVATIDRGKLGHELRVKLEGLDTSHDLTNVGVGVSQVLPIVVMALIAPPNALLIFEQPELHLHPKVQARLADFFLSLSLIGKQCILETHSEYMIERFRRRVAEAPGDELARRLKIYFVDRSSGESLLRSVDVSRYGSINDYPKDFFDQTMSDAEGILQASLKKRAAEREAK